MITEENNMNKKILGRIKIESNCIFPVGTSPVNDIKKDTSQSWMRQ